jgi:hypothetical protein
MPATRVNSDEKRRRHIEEMREKLERLSGHPDCVFLSPDLDDGLQEKFLEHILAFEGADEIPLSKMLEKSGISLPPARRLHDAQLTAKLWEVIRAMALLGHYLHSTDHLSDRQLYEKLRTETLPEPTSILPTNPNFACHIDLLGGWSTEDTQIYLKYYADEEERQSWLDEWPQDTLPEHQDPPYDRDRHLPRSPQEFIPVRECS